MQTIKEIGLSNLKEKTKIKFAKDTYAIVTNYESNISNLTGVISNIDLKDGYIWVKLDKPHKDFKDYDNEIQFGLSEDSSGTHISYLLKSFVI